MSYTHVLLDLDHTLLDTDTSLELAFADAMAEAGADADGQYPVFDKINSALWKRVEAQELSPPEVHVTRFAELNDQLTLGADPQRMADAFALGMGSHGDLYSGAIEMLDAIVGSATLALVTNGLSDIQRARIERLALGQYFDVVTISAEVGCSKPGVEIFELTFAALGITSAAQALMVGDNLGSDIAGGNAAGIDTCWYNPQSRPASGEHLATFTIETLIELTPIVAGV